MMRKSAGLLALLALTSGCYTYADVARESVTPGMDVRVTLNRAEAVRRAEEAGEIRETLSGTAAEQTGNQSLALTLPARGTTFREFAAIPWTGVVRIEEKSFSPRRTGGLAAIGVAATILILSVIEGETDGNGEGPPINESAWVRVPLIRIGW